MVLLESFASYIKNIVRNEPYFEFEDRVIYNIENIVVKCYVVLNARFNAVFEYFRNPLHTYI